MQKIVKAFDEDMFESLAKQRVHMEEFLFSDVGGSPQYVRVS